MSTTSDETTVEELSLLDDLELNENDLTEEAKTRFSYHTDILNSFETYRCRILRDKNLSRISRHEMFCMLDNYYKISKQVLNYMAQNEELHNRNLPTVGPIVICSLPRTGTTLLYNLLACDPQCRAPLFTDIYIEPVPPIARSNSVEQKRRAAITQPLLKMFSEKMDGAEHSLESSHPFYAVEEDSGILCQGGLPGLYSMMILDSECDFSVRLSDSMKKDFAYDYHETFLRMLNSVDAPSSHWLLKAPVHLLHLDTLLRHYPNAGVIMTHRNINEVLPSFHRLVISFEDWYSIEVNSPSVRETLTAQYIQYFDRMIECLVKFRTEQSTKNVFDVIYDDLMEQPIRTVRRIYDYFGLKWSDEFEIGMQSWLHDNPQGKRGRHTYSLADIGLTHEGIETRYADYTNLFLRSSNPGNTGDSQFSSTDKCSTTV